MLCIVESSSQPSPLPFENQFRGKGHFADRCELGSPPGSFDKNLPDFSNELVDVGVIVADSLGHPVQPMTEARSVDEVGEQCLQPYPRLSAVSCSICYEETHQIVVKIVTEEVEENRHHELLRGAVVCTVDVGQIDKERLQEGPVEDTDKNGAHCSSSAVSRLGDHNVTSRWRT